METFSVRDLQKRYACSEHKILEWINSGELRAINCVVRVGKKPRWRITAEAVAEFEEARTNKKVQVDRKKQRRQRSKEGIGQTYERFYPE